MRFAGANPLGHFGYWAAAAGIVAMGWTLYEATVTTREASLRVDRTMEALQDVSRLTESVSRAESAQRGFLLTQEQPLLLARDEALAAAELHLANLQKRLGDDPGQTARVAALRDMLAARVALMRANEGLRRRESLEALAVRMRSGGGQRDSAAIHADAEKIRAHELRLLELRRDEQRYVHQNAVNILALGGFILMAVMVSGYLGFIREARGRHRAEKQVVDLAENLPGAVFQFRVHPDGRMRYEFLSGQTETLRGVSRAAALRDASVILDTVLEADRKSLLERVSQSREDLKPFEHDFRAKDPAGGVRWLRVLASPRLEADGSLLINGHWGDVTEQKKLARELREAKEAADSASRAKSTFLATMSHEIRTPMNGVLGMLELLSVSKLDGEQRTTLEIVKQSARSLLRIIDDILDLSKIEAGKLELRPEVASIAHIVERTCNIYMGNASSKGLLLTRLVDSRLSPAVIVDPLRLQQVLNNFVSNAIKFTSDGEVTIRAELVERRDGEDLVRFLVADSGIGISKADQEKLFQPFAQAGESTTVRFGGTGLGLSICQRLASLMGGRVAMDSEVGRGTVMSLVLALPIADPNALNAATGAEHTASVGMELAGRRRAPSVDEARREGTLLLIVDDHPINRMVLLKQVNALGYAAEVAENGLEALDKWSTGGCVLVLTDCNMPEMNGYDLARHIRSCESHNGHLRTTVIACTANALGGEADACLAAGMDDYLAKPVEIGCLAKKLDQWLPLTLTAAQGTAAELADSLSHLGVPRAQQRGGLAPIDRTVLAEITAGDLEMERDILERWRACNAEDANLLLNAIEREDLREVSHASHRIKGASKTIGALSLAAVCERLERASRANDWGMVTANVDAFSNELDRVNHYVSTL